MELILGATTVAGALAALALIVVVLMGLRQQETQLTEKAELVLAEIDYCGREHLWISNSDQL